MAEAILLDELDGKEVEQWSKCHKKFADKGIIATEYCKLYRSIQDEGKVLCVNISFRSNSWGACSYI